MQIKTKVSLNSETFKAYRIHHLGVMKELNDRVQSAHLGGGESALEKQRMKGKLSVRERIEILTDPNSDFLEFSSLAGYGIYDDDVPSAGIVTGIGLVHGRPCMIVANDPTVKGGTYYPITVKKHLRAQ